MTEQAAIQPQSVTFYDDELAVVVREGQPYVPLRTITDAIGLTYGSQYNRVMGDEVLSRRVVTLPVLAADGRRRELVCLPLTLFPGWLFGISPNRVKGELREKLIRYREECFDVLWEAFQERRLTADPVLQDLLAQNTPEAQAYQWAQGVLQLARNQLLIRSQLDDHTQRLEAIEANLGQPDRAITQDQAAQVSQAVKAVAMIMTKASGANQYGAVYGELYRKFGVTSYKLIPASRFQEVMGWLTDWHQDLVGDVPF